MRKKHLSESPWYKLIHYGLEFFGLYYSTYRGFVVDNDDTQGLNRVKVIVPSLIKDDAGTWAFPKGQWGAKGYGVQMLPKKGDMVMVEFDHGNLDYPLWVHTGYGDKEKPDDFKSLTTIGIITPNGNRVLINDGENNEDGNILVKFKTSNEYILISKDYIEQEATQIKLGKDGTYKGVKGETNVDKLEAICDRISDMLDTFISHTHPSDGAPAANIPQAEIVKAQVEQLKQTLNETLSDKVKLD